MARADPDGYTMLVTSSAIAIIQSMYKTMRFDPMRDLTPVTLVTLSPFLMVVHPSVPVKSAAELAALAKAQPGKIAGASSGVGTTNHLTLEMFKSMARTERWGAVDKSAGIEPQ